MIDAPIAPKRQAVKRLAKRHVATVAEREALIARHLKSGQLCKLGVQHRFQARAARVQRVIEVEELITLKTLRFCKSASNTVGTAVALLRARTSTLHTALHEHERKRTTEVEGDTRSERQLPWRWQRSGIGAHLLQWHLSW